MAFVEWTPSLDFKNFESRSQEHTTQEHTPILYFEWLIFFILIDTCLYFEFFFFE